MLFTHALVPSAFRLQVSAMIQESPSKFFLTASGILKPRHAAHRNRTPTAGVAILPWARKQGKSCLNGSGTCVWSWAISSILIRCAPPSLLRLSHRSQHTQLLLRAMLPLREACPGKLVASRGKTLSPSLMARCVVRLASRMFRMSGAERLMEACAWCMRPALAGVVPALCARSVNGMAVRPPSRAFVSVLLHPLVVGSKPLRLSGLESEASPTGVHPVAAPSMRHRRDRTSHHDSPHRHACAPFPCAVGALSADVSRAAGEAPRAPKLLDR